MTQESGFEFILSLTKEEKEELLKIWKEREGKN